MLKVKLTNEQEVVVTIAPKTDGQKPATLDGLPACTVVTGNSQVTQSEDGLSLKITSSNDPGVTQILVKADANLARPEEGGAENYEEISEIIEVTVEAASAKNLGLTVGTPTQKPEVVVEPPAPPAEPPTTPPNPAARR